MSTKVSSVINKTQIVINIIIVFTLINYFLKVIPYQDVFIGAAIILGSVNFFLIAVFARKKEKK
ncbi:hypothetical protein [Alkalitalea saponilacus]|uniref:Uncharacterized protein n=1 Tax=Alkalitalea saponilacus TaxID=889453 RepID=A0A1T5HTB9_9BACT|nr:hypothetical protein [Alkalitalea saponilacus]ASB49276.1 hypothetical protein CDL62_09045 [Alkalitalea saponilacus]SKC23761.1 hypothetical protein SAMN03080601_03046 [Alkalitalea saponilacus]